MPRLIAMALLVLATACASSPVSPNAGADVTAWVHNRYGEQLRDLQIFYGDFTGDRARDALAWVTYNDGGLHNFAEASLFRSEGGRLVYWRTDDEASGEAPRDVTFARGRITLTTTILQDGDARCCPSGAQHWMIEAR